MQRKGVGIELKHKELYPTSNWWGINGFTVKTLVEAKELSEKLENAQESTEKPLSDIE